MESPLPLESSNIEDPLSTYYKQGLFDSDEPGDLKRVKEYVSYVNKFKDYFNNKHFELASRLAANSPDGILRTYNVFLQFKNASKTQTTFVGDSPILTFCKSIMNSPATSNNVLSPSFSAEIIQCALKNDDILLLKHWMVSDIITYSLDLGDFLYTACKCPITCSCNLITLALLVYTKLGVAKKIVFAHVKLGNIFAIKSFIKKYNFDIEDCKQIFKQQPSLELLVLLAEDEEEITNISFPAALSIMLDSGLIDRAINLLLHVHKKGYGKQTLIECLMNESRDDKMGESKWKQLLFFCRKNRQYKVSEELLASLITRTALENASISFVMDYYS